MAIRRKLAVLVCGPVLAAGSLLLGPVTVHAVGFDCGQTLGYHYAGQYTSTYNGSTTQCAPYREYGGWNGIDGQPQLPASLAVLGNYQTDHTVGWIGAQLNSDQQWLQIGWYTGCITDLTGGCTGTCQPPACTWRGVSYGWYIENQKPGGASGYTVTDEGYAAPGAARTSDIIYNKNTGCWEAYLDYDGRLTYSDCSEGAHISGAMVATTEMDDNSGTAPGLPTAYFGTSNANTNQALRVHGANGWVSWTKVLSSYYTETFDEHSYTPGYTYSQLSSSCCWDFEAYKSA